MYGSPVARVMRTPTGLKWTTISFVVYVVGLVVQLAVGIVALSTLASLRPNMTANEILAVLGPLLALALVFVIVVIVAFILYCIGFGYLYGGRAEFGPAHAKDVRWALYLFIGAIGTGVASVIATIVIAFSGARLTGPNPTIDPAAQANLTVASVAFGIIIGTLVAGVLVLSVRRLVEPRHLMFLYAAGAIGAATPVILGALVLWQLPRMLAALGGNLAFDATLGLPTAVGGGLSLLTFALYLVLYRGAAARIRSGALPPVVPAPAPVQYWPPGPWTPPPSAPPPQPPMSP